MSREPRAERGQQGKGRREKERDGLVVGLRSSVACRGKLATDYGPLTTDNGPGREQGTSECEVGD